MEYQKDQVTYTNRFRGGETRKDKVLIKLKNSETSFLKAKFRTV